IHARLALALGAVSEGDLAALRAAWKEGPAEYAEALSKAMTNPHLSSQVPILLYRTMDLPADLREGAVVLALALRAALQNPRSLGRPGFGGSALEAAQALFTAALTRHEGVVFAIDQWDEVLSRVGTPDGKLHLALEDMLGELAKLPALEAEENDAYPFVLSAGERRSFTANTILRDPAWRKKDERGALRIHPADAAALGVAA